MFVLHQSPRRRPAGKGSRSRLSISPSAPTSRRGHAALPSSPSHSRDKAAEIRRRCRSGMITLVNGDLQLLQAWPSAAAAFCSVARVDGRRTLTGRRRNKGHRALTGAGWPPTLLRPAARCQAGEAGGALLSGIQTITSPSRHGALRQGPQPKAQPTSGSSRSTSSSPTAFQRKLVPARRINWPRMPSHFHSAPPNGLDPTLQLGPDRGGCSKEGIRATRRHRPRLRQRGEAGRGRRRRWGPPRHP